MLDKVMLRRIALVSLLIGGATIMVFELELVLGMRHDVARTTAVNTLVIAQACYLFNSRFLAESSLRWSLLFRNRVAWGAVAVLMLLQLAFVYVPIMQIWFGTANLGLRHWVGGFVVGLFVFLAIELDKALARRRSQTS